MQVVLRRGCGTRKLCVPMCHLGLARRYTQPSDQAEIDSLKQELERMRKLLEESRSRNKAKVTQQAKNVPKKETKVRERKPEQEPLQQTPQQTMGASKEEPKELEENEIQQEENDQEVSKLSLGQYLGQKLKPTDTATPPKLEAPATTQPTKSVPEEEEEEDKDDEYDEPLIPLIKRPRLSDEHRIKFFELSQRIDAEMKRRNYKQALQHYLDFMEEEGYPQNDLVLSHQLLRLAAKTNDLWLAKKVYEDMRERGDREWVYDPVAFSILVTLNFMHRRYSEIDKLWKEMVENKVFVTIGTLHALHSFGRQAKWPEIVAVLSFMKENNIAISSATYAIIIRELVARNMLNTVGAILDQMQDSGISPTVELFNSLLNLFGTAGKYEQMESSYDTMLLMNITPIHETYSQIIYAFMNSGRIDKALHYFEEMKQRMNPGEKLYVELLSTLKKYDRPRERRQIRGELLDLRRQLQADARELQKYNLKE